MFFFIYITIVFFRINRFFLNRKIIKIWMATLLLMLLVVQLVSHLKKSFLQYSFPSREKHLSVKVHLQSQHWTHLMCHGLSRTLSRNRSTMGFSQLAQYSIACLQAAVNPPTKHTNDDDNDNTVPITSQIQLYQERRVVSSIPRVCVCSGGQQPSTCGHAAPLLGEPLHPKNSILVFLLLLLFNSQWKKMPPVLALQSAFRVQRWEGETAVGTRSARACDVYPCSAAVTSPHVWRRRRTERSFFKSSPYCPLRRRWRHL